MSVVKKYRLNDDGTMIDAIVPSQVVTAMRDSSFFAKDESLTEFMIGFAQRYEIQTGHKIRHHSLPKFLNDLINTGYITIIE